MKGDWKLIYYHADQHFELFNIANDIGETLNLASEKPEYITNMKVLLEKIITDGRSTPGPKQHNDVEVLRFVNQY